MTQSINKEYDYPEISDRLIECLDRDFPDKLPRQQLTEFELGMLVGRMNVIDKLKLEKEYNEKLEINDEDEE
jgi:hypothetical protein